MRLTRHFLCLLPLFAAGCARLPEEPIFVYGSALEPDGSPLADATLNFERIVLEPLDHPPGPDEDGVLDGIPDEPSVFEPYGTATTRADGEYTLQALAGDVEEELPGGWGFRQYRFRVAQQRESGQGTFMSFSFTDDVEVPPLRIWDDRFTVKEGPEGPSLSFAPAPPAPELPPTGSLRTILYGPQQELEMQIPPSTPEPIVQLFSGGERMWRESGMSSPWTPSPYVLEDFASPDAQLRAMTVGEWQFSPLGGSFSFTLFRQEWRTPHLPLPAGAVRPVSRGASCEPSPTPSAPCPWTDGKLTPVEFPSTDDLGDAPRSLVITLAEPTHLQRAVIRGLIFGHARQGAEYLRVEGSSDGEHWFPLGNRLVRDLSYEQMIVQINTFDSAYETAWDSPFDGKLEQFNEIPVYLEVPLESAEPVRQVRIQTELPQQVGIGGILFSLAEVSLFE